MLIKEFCDMVEKEYLYYLYKEKIVFPYCCHTSANLIASYLTVHFDKLYEHRVCTKKIHGWTANEELMIDFTGFQFFISHKFKEKFRNQNKNITESEFYDIIDFYKNSSPLIADNSTDHFKSWNKDIESFKTCELYGIEFAKKTREPMTIEGFMNYVEIALEEVDMKIVRDKLYR